MNELITIIVPVYKVEDYLERCVDSILCQVYAELEIILVDDGSPDRCGEICEAYAKRDPRVKVIHKKNGGLSDARNAGIEQANGRYITFLDSDDWVHEEYVSHLYDLLKKTDADISVCGYLTLGSEQIPDEPAAETVHEFTGEEALDRLVAFGDLHAQMIVAWGKLYKTALFDGILFPYGRIHEDEFTTYKLLYRARKVAVTTRKLLYYWQREDSIMGSGFKVKNKLDFLDSQIERGAFFNEHGLNDLRDRTYKALFTELLATDLALEGRNEEKASQEVLAKFETVRRAIRENGQSKIGLLYGSHHLLPGAVRTLYKAYRSLKK